MATHRLPSDKNERAWRPDCVTRLRHIEVPTTTQQPLPSGQAARVGEAVAVRIPHNYVVKKLDSQEFACAADAFSQLNIVLAGGWIARRMIVLCAAPRYVISGGVGLTSAAFSSVL